MVLIYILSQDRPVICGHHCKKEETDIPGMKLKFALLLVVLALSATTTRARLRCPSYEELATPAAAQLDTSMYEGFWYEVYSHNVFLVDSCHCTRYNFSMISKTKFTDVFTCHKHSPTSPPFVIPNTGSVDPTTPGKMVESLGPATPPYWVLGLWDRNGKLLTSSKPGQAYAFALVYACVGSPLLGEFTYFFSRNSTLPDPVYAEMRSFASKRNISLSSVKQVPMEGCKWA